MSKCLLFGVEDNIGNTNISIQQFGNTNIFKEEWQLLLTCYVNVLNKFWEQKKYFVSFPYKEGQSISHQTTSQLKMSHKLCKQEMNTLSMGLIRPSKSQWASPAFYINKHSKQVWGNKRLVIWLQDVERMPKRYQIFYCLKAPLTEVDV